MHTIIPLLNELDPDIGNEIIVSRVTDMVENGYECVGIYTKDDLIGICGIWTLYKYYVGKHMELDNVYIKPKFQSSGLGNLLINWLKEFANSRSYKAIELNCYQGNVRGNEFWLKNNFQELATHYQLKV